MSQISRKHANTLGVRVDSTHKASVLRFVRANIAKAKKFYIVSTNPEIVMKAQKDPDLAQIINSADISLPDGIGLISAHKFFQLPNPKEKFLRVLTLFAQGLGIGFSVLFNREWLMQDLKLIKGREIFMDLVNVANKKGWRVFLIGGERGEADGTKKELEKIYKRVKIVSFQGPMLDESGEPISKNDKDLEEKAVQKINYYKPHLLFVAFKFPRQEKWVYRWYNKLNIGGAMTVGGTFNYIAGKSKLPPKWFEDRGLEWFWRLINEPKRGKRIFDAFPRFPLVVFWKKLIS